MDIHIVFRHMEGSESLKTYTEEKAKKLEKYFIKATKMNVVFSLEKFVHKTDIVLFEKDHVFKAEGMANDMYISLDQAMHGLEEQLKRYKEKVVHHKDPSKSQEALLQETQITNQFVENIQPKKNKNKKKST